MRIKNKGINFIVSGWITINHPENITVGDNVHLSKGMFIDSRGKVEIGDNISISSNVSIYTTTHNYNNFNNLNEKSFMIKNVKIGDNVWMCEGVKLLPGITIGNNVIIQAGTIVTKDVPDNAIIGMPQFNIIKYRKFKGLS